MQRFDIKIPNKKSNSYYLIAWFFAFIIYAFEVYLAFSDSDKQAQRIWVIGGLTVPLLMLFISRGVKLKNWSGVRYIGVAYGFLAVPLLKWQLYWPVVAIFLFIILLSIATREFRVIVSKDNITFPSFPKKVVAWHSLNNLVFKDDLLTIDFKNNKVFQQIIVQSETGVNEQEFNDFCTQQLALAASHLPKSSAEQV
jgi:hypothetical protein